jgi:AcrR family transcriptional regulator
VVAVHRRERLLGAAAEAVAAKGYASLVVNDIVDRAGVSRATFYELFDDKLDCVLAAHAAAVERFKQAISGAGASQEDWPVVAAAAVAAALDFTAEHPAEVELLLAAAHVASEPKLSRRGVAAQQELVALLRSGRRHCSGASTPLDLTEQAIVAAAMAVVGARLAHGESDRLGELRPELVQLVLTPYVGEDEAKRVALTG